jgi:hypothetical protein
VEWTHLGYVNEQGHFRAAPLWVCEIEAPVETVELVALQQACAHWALLRVLLVAATGMVRKQSCAKASGLPWAELVWGQSRESS